MRRINLGIVAAGIAALFAASPVTKVAAQEYPNKPIHVICAYPAGSPPDILVRYVAEAIRKAGDAYNRTLSDAEEKQLETDPS